MFNCSKLAQAAIAFASISNALSIVEMTDQDHPSDLLLEHDFTIINFYDSSEESQKIKEIFAGARGYVLDKIAEEKWHGRDILWVQADIEKYPKLAMDNRGPTQMVYSQEIKLKQNIDWYVTPEATMEQEVEAFSMIVRELTGEWIHFVECEDIQHEGRYFYDEFVYFGDADDLDYGGNADNIITLSMVDRYSFSEQRVRFYYNDDPLCRETM